MNFSVILLHLIHRKETYAGNSLAQFVCLLVRLLKNVFKDLHKIIAEVGAGTTSEDNPQSHLDPGRICYHSEIR